MPVLYDIDNRIWPSSALETVRVATDQKNLLVKSNKNGIELIKTRKNSIPSDQNAVINIKFNKFSKENYVSAIDVINNDFDQKRIKNKTGHIISAFDFFNTPLKDESLKNIKQDFYARFGQALANLINILDPDIVVLGGGLSNEQSLYKEGIDEVYSRIFNDVPSTPIVKNKLGDSAGVIGAALIGRGLTQ